MMQNGVITVEEFLAEAATWERTPYVHQGRLKGLGADCVGFIAGVGRATGLTPDVAYSNDYRATSDGRELLDLLQTHCLLLKDREQARAGMLVAFYNGAATDAAQRWHVGIIYRDTPYREIIHADPKRGVVRHRLALPLWEKVVGVWCPKRLTIDLEGIEFGEWTTK